MTTGSEERLTLEIESIQLRQNLSREMHQRYGFTSFEVKFEGINSINCEFIITKKLKEIVEDQQSTAENSFGPINPI